MEKKTMSPPAKKTTAVVTPNTLSFPAAILMVTKNKKIRRLEWPNSEDFGFLSGGVLKIRLNGVDHNWILNDGDILAEDWIVMEVDG